MIRTALALLLFVPCAASTAEAQSFVNWESPHVHPLDLTPNGELLVAVNTAAARLEVFDATGAMLEPAFSVPVGLDPVSVRARTNDEVWVVNHLSDSVSVVSLSQRSVVRTLDTEDEPCDVVFAGTPLRAFVSCSQVNEIHVFTPSGAFVQSIAINGEDPRALAVSPDGTQVYAAVFESGNATTILGGGLNGSPVNFPKNVVNDPLGPYGGVNPPPNDGANFTPAQKPGNPAPPRVSLIVKKDESGNWLDDNAGDWTSIVTGPLSDRSDRPLGWDLPDRDLAVIDASTLSVQTYATRLMNLCMALGVNPDSGDVVVIGTEATNEIRFEPNIKGTFVRVHAARVDAAGTVESVHDLNPHLDYSTSNVPQAIRDLSIGDPRAIIFKSDGTRGWVAGMGSNNVIRVNGNGERVASAATIEVGEGPTGFALDETSDRLFVLSKFEASISVIDLSSETETQRLGFFDPTPVAIKTGRKHLYGTHENSGLGQIACASCHVDARIDRLSWDLGDPSGDMKDLGPTNCPDGFCEDWHPMKGPMLTQTFQDIIGKEPLHWRGDRSGLEEFATAFDGLQGDDAPLDPVSMQEFEDFLATITFPPNPFRNFDNSLPTDLDLDGHFTTGRFGPDDQPLPNGDAQNGLEMYTPPQMLDGGVHCSTCHTLPVGSGTPFAVTLFPPTVTPIPPGPNGEAHLMVVSTDGSTNRTQATPQLRNLYDRVGFETTLTENNAGFGFLHDGSVDSLAHFLNEPAFSLVSDQETADLLAFMLAFSGSDLPAGSMSNPLNPPGTNSQDSHAAVGTQLTFTNGVSASPEDLLLYAEMRTLADLGKVGLIAKGRVAGAPRGWTYVGSDVFQSDRQFETASASTLRTGAVTGAEVTVTVVPFGTQVRLGIDRDEDGFFDRDEIELISDPDDASSTPLDNLVAFCFGDGSGAPCPCGNEVAAGVQSGCSNSSGLGAQLTGSGSPQIGSDTLRFELTGGPFSTFGFLASGGRALPTIEPGAGLTTFDALRCVGGGLLRHGTRGTNSVGEIGTTGPAWGMPDGPTGGIGAQGGFVSGQSRFFQVFIRDSVVNGCGSGLTFSNAVRVTFQ